MRIFYVGAMFVEVSPVGVTISAANRQGLFLATSITVRVAWAAGYAARLALGAGLGWYATVATAGLALASLRHFTFAWRYSRAAPPVSAGGRA